MDPIKFSKLSHLYSKFNNARLARNRVTPNNISSLLDSFEVPKDFSVLNLDIDSYDLDVINKMLSSGFKPLIITMEINEKIPSGIFFTVKFDDDHFWKGDHFFGCSIDAACQIVKPYGYKLVKLEYNNAFFVRSDQDSPVFIDLTAEEAYKVGYRERPDRKTVFPWNANVEHWLSLDIDVAINEIKSYFAIYDKKFTIYNSGAV